MVDTKWLLIRNDVVLSPQTSRVIASLDPYFGRHQHTAYVTSAVRNPESQLALIKKECIKRGIDKEFPEILICGLEDKNGGLFLWQSAWSRLLNKGFIISPPIAAVALYDYFKGGRNKKGEIIWASTHFTGHALDIGGRGGTDPTPKDEVEVISEAMAEDPGIGIISFLLERENNCLHVNVK